MITTAYVHLWGKRVGAVAWDAASGVASFEFEPSFTMGGLNVAPLKMPVESGQAIFSFPELMNTSFKGLPGLLADVLPDKYGSALINVWLARNGRPANSLNPVEMLCYIGKRGMGALEFEPALLKGKNVSTTVELDSLIDMASNILTGRQRFKADLSAHEEKALMDILRIGTSAGGARAKAIIAYNPASGEVRSGQADAPKGFSQWLIKFDGVNDNQLGVTLGYGRVEMAYHLMTKDCGIEMMESRLLEENGRAHFMTRRFDRPGGKEKLHVQSFCALQHFDFNDIQSYSYEQLFQTMRQLRLPYPQAEELFRRMVFNVLARNCDDHTKNFSFIMDRSGTWRLAPAFDMCHAYRPGSEWVSQQSLSVNGKRKDITVNDFLEVARNMSIKKPDAIIDRINRVVKKWPGYAGQAKVSGRLRDAILKTLIIL
ncbi:MAG: type II toxin-antitoxin system HipA family toxin [Bacteroidetes bacterium]|nr:type II toxin-antitoxin system HipA family toxin [Bacteroidota bacterium]